MITRDLCKTLGVLLGALALCACTPRVSPAPGCRPWDYSLESTEPPAHCLFFPVGLALDPLGDLLYVTNSNADLSFGGATVVAVDLLRYERAVSCFRRHGAAPGRRGDGDCGIVDCQDSGQGRLGEGATVEAIERHEQDRGALADFDRCYCQADPLDPGIVNCASDRFVLRQQAVKTGNFSGQLRLKAEDPADWTALPPGQPLRRRLYLPVRGDPSITYIDVDRPGRQRRPGEDPGVRLACGLPKDGPVFVCDDAHRVQRTNDTVPINPDRPEEGERARLTLPPEPISIAIDSGCKLSGYRHRRGDLGPAGQPLCRNGAGDVRDDLYYEFLISSHLSGEELAALDLRPAAGRPELTDVRGGLLQATSGGQRGAFVAAPRVRGDLSQPWYLTSRLSGQISTFRLLSSGPAIVPGLLFSISNNFAGTGMDVRDLAFTPDGERAFLTLPAPPTLAVLDTRPDPLTGIPHNQVVGLVGICPSPSRMAVSLAPRDGPGGRTQRRPLVYVACYQAGQVAVVDPDTALLAATIQVGRGPQTLVFNFGGEPEGGTIDPCADPYVSDEEARRRGVTCPAGGALRVRPMGQADLGPRAYVTTYLDNAIAVIDLDPRSQTYHRVVSRIGVPAPKQVQ